MPVPAIRSTCQTKLMGPVIAPVPGLSASVMSAAETVSTWFTAGSVSSIVSWPTGSALSPSTRTMAWSANCSRSILTTRSVPSGPATTLPSTSTTWCSTVVTPVTASLVTL
ncbi:hypothetical protein D9M68_594620 [compost metagenome]